MDREPLCLTIVSLVPSATTRKDVDNLVRGLLDSMQGSFTLMTAWCSA
jgi:Holliday junction resolvase RusA-like endonuclease